MKPLCMKMGQTSCNCFQGYWQPSGNCFQGYWQPSGIFLQGIRGYWQLSDNFFVQESVCDLLQMV